MVVERSGEERESGVTVVVWWVEGGGRYGVKAGLVLVRCLTPRDSHSLLQSNVHQGPRSRFLRTRPWTRVGKVDGAQRP